MLRHLSIVDRRLEFLATLSDSVDTVEAEEAAVGSLEVGRPSGELQDRPEQQEQLIRCVVEGVMAKGDKGISVSWRFGWKPCDFERCWFHFDLAGRGAAFLSPSLAMADCGFMDPVALKHQVIAIGYSLIGERHTELL